MRVLMIAFAIFGLPLSALAGISRPDSSVAFSRDGTRMLVMRSPAAQCDLAPTAMLADGRVVTIADTFAKSGVYDSRTLQPIWQVDWYDHDWNLLCSDDLRNVARIDRTGYSRDSALQFYDNGTLIRSYACTDLLTGLRRETFLPYSTWDWHEQWYDEFDLAASRADVSLSTARRGVYVLGYRVDLGLQETYRFDLRTGAMWTKSVTGRWVIWAYGASALLLAITLPLAARVLWRRMQRRISLRRRGFEVVSRSLDGEAPAEPPAV